MSCLKVPPVLLLQTNTDLLEAVYCLVGLQRVTQSTSFDQVRVKQLALPWIRVFCNGWVSDCRPQGAQVY